MALLVSVIAASCATALMSAPVAQAQQEKLVFCSDIAYPPMEYFDGSQPVGADIDIGSELAERIGREAEFSNVGFDAIIAALLGNQCDLIISSMNDTPERAKQVDFVDYLSFGQSLVVQKGNPLGITTLETLCGHDAGAQVGTTQLDHLNQASEACKTAGAEAIDITGYKSDADAMLALKADQVDAYVTDSPVAAYYIGQDPEAFEFGGSPIGAAPVGMAFRKEDTALRDQVKETVAQMYADGSMMTILKDWSLEDFALPELGAATPEASPAATPAAG
jgi:polar amino acid transport system substrate-binding protein